MDLALDNDINIEQFEFFANLAKNFKRDDNVIVVTHTPFCKLLPNIYIMTNDANAFQRCGIGVLTNYEEYSVQPETVRALKCKWEV